MSSMTKGHSCHTVSLNHRVLAAGILILMMAFHTFGGALPDSRRVFQHFNSTDGLSHDSVYEILQDHRGLIWFATENGLNRYDGVEVSSFKNDPRNPLSLSENDINTILEGPNGRIWIGTWGGGIDCFDPIGGIFSHVIAQSPDGFSLLGARILSLQIEHPDHLWVGTWNNGLFRISLSTGRLEHFPTPGSNNLREGEQDHVWNIVRDRKDTIWIGTQGGLFLLRPGPSFEAVSAGEEWVRGMTQAPGHGIYFNNGAAIFQAKLEGDGIRRRKIIDLEPGVALTTLFLDHQDILWAGSRRHGLLRIDPPTGKLEKEEHEESDTRSLAYNNIRSIMEDHSHNLWIGTRGGGADRLDLKPSKFQMLSQSDSKLPSDSVWAFLVDHRGDLWIGTDNGLCRIPADGSEMTIHQPENRDAGPAGREKIRALAEDPGGSLWIGSKGGGLDRLDSSRRVFTHYRVKRNSGTGLSSNFITAIAALPDGRLFVGTDDHGLEEFRPDTSTFIHHPVNPEIPGGNRVSALSISENGRIWIGTDGGGLAFLDSGTGEISRLPALDAAGGHITAISEDPEGRIYVGTHAGLYILNESLEVIRVLTQDDGLSDNTIYGIIRAPSSGDLWMTTNQGLSRYSPESGRVRNYGVDDGLVSMGFNDGAAYLGPEGQAFIGGNRGLNYFFPDRVEDNPFPPEMILTGIILLNNPDQPSIQPEATRPLILDWKNNSLGFHWIGLEFTKPGSIHYAFRLEGYDSDWIDGGKINHRRYTNLGAGRYVFHVRGANHDDTWSDVISTPEIRIRAPYWKHPLFVLAAVLLIGLVFWLLHRLLSIALRRKNRELEEQMKLRAIAEEKATRYAGELERATLFDPLTALPNRALIADRIRVLLSRCRRNPASTFAVLALDLDEFRIINDSLGHRLGDELLRQLAERLEEVIRADDTLGRLGGDEFVIILHSATTSTSLEEFAQRVHQAIRPPFLLDNREVSTTASIGMVLGCVEYTNPEELLRDADTAMYRAKRLGRSRQVLFDPGMHLEASNILKLENDLRRALKNGEFLLHYQPIIDLKKEQLIAFEALVRWKPPQGEENIAPRHFLDRIRSAGLARELGSWVLEECCRQASIWYREESQEIGLAANLFIQQILDPGLPEQLRRLLELNSCPASILHLEITEEVLIDAPESAITVLSALQRLGTRINLDDFGSGFSSLNYLRRFPVDIVKIDKSFVSSMLQDTNSTKIVEAIILLAHGLGKRTIAEGIESAEVAHELKKLGCDLGQGYYFSKGVSPIEARKMIRNGNPDWLG